MPNPNNARRKKLPPPPPSRLSELRQLRKLSLEDIAQSCDCYRSAVSRWERLETEPEIYLRRPYATSLGLTVGELGRLIYEDSVNHLQAKTKKDAK